MFPYIYAEYQWGAAEYIRYKKASCIDREY